MMVPLLPIGVGVPLQSSLSNWSLLDHLVGANKHYVAGREDIKGSWKICPDIGKMLGGSWLAENKLPVWWFEFPMCGGYGSSLRILDLNDLVPRKRGWCLPKWTNVLLWRSMATFVVICMLYTITGLLAWMSLVSSLPPIQDLHEG
jgi:hypothetical protein